jgi:hypothetical protein
MPIAEKIKRNKQLVKLRNENPKIWSFSKLGVEFNISKIMAHRIYNRLNKSKVNTTVDKG